MITEKMIEAHARADAAFAERDFDGMSAADKTRFRERSKVCLQAALAAGETEVAALSQLHAIVDAWEALPGGRQVRNSDVEAWLGKHMGPGIDAIRGFLRRPRPDGVTPPSPSPSTPSPRKDEI